MENIQNPDDEQKDNRQKSNASSSEEQQNIQHDKVPVKISYKKLSKRHRYYMSRTPTLSDQPSISKQRNTSKVCTACIKSTAPRFRTAPAVHTAATYLAASIIRISSDDDDDDFVFKVPLVPPLRSKNVPSKVFSSEPQNTLQGKKDKFLSYVSLMPSGKKMHEERDLLEKSSPSKETKNVPHQLHSSFYVFEKSKSISKAVPESFTEQLRKMPQTQDVSVKKSGNVPHTSQYVSKKKLKSVKKMFLESFLAKSKNMPQSSEDAYIEKSKSEPQVVQDVFQERLKNVPQEDQDASMEKLKSTPDMD